MIRNKPSPEGRALGEQLARFCDAEIERYRGTGIAVPRRCDTCAFRARTYANGCLTTVADVLKCALEGVTFECHEHRKGDTAPLCAGWMILKSGDDSVKTPWDFVGDGSKAA